MDERIFFFIGYAALFGSALLLGRYLAGALPADVRLRRRRLALVASIGVLLCIPLGILIVDPTRPGFDRTLSMQLALVFVATSIVAFLLLLALGIWAAVVAQRRRELMPLLRKSGRGVAYHLGLAGAGVVGLLTAIGSLLTRRRSASAEPPVGQAGISDYVGRRPATMTGLNEMKSDPFGLDRGPNKTYAYLALPEDDD